jgi:hypothetical protein
MIQELTQEQKDLLLKDLCSRLPYGVKIQTPTNCWTSEEGICELKEIFKGDDGLFRIGDVGALLKYSKPYLFPLSSMTEEQRKELFYLSGIDIINGKFYTNNEFTLEETLSGINWLLKNYFDINGLIPQGLAKDATNLNIY